MQEDLTKLKEIPDSLAIFVMATYGEGDPTDNAQDFHDWLQEGSADLTGLKYAVIYIHISNLCVCFRKCSDESFVAVSAFLSHNAYKEDVFAFSSCSSVQTTC